MSELLPLLRISSGFLSTRIIAIYGNHILVGGRPASKLGVTEEMCTADGEPTLRRLLRRTRSINLEAVTAIREEFSTPPKWLKTTRPIQIGNSRFTLISKHQRPIHFTIQHKQVASFRKALKSLAGDRYWIRTTWQAEGCGLAVALIIGAFLLPFFALSLYSAFSEQSTGAAGATLMLFLLSVSLIFLLNRRGAWVLLDNFPVESLVPQPDQKQPTKVRNPIYSPTLGWVLKIIGVAYWIVIASPLTDNFGHNQQVWTLVWLPAPWLIWTGYRLCQRPYKSLNPNDARKPILFLRPFTDDAAATLQPPGVLALISGVRSQATTWFVKNSQSGKTSPQDLMYTLYPIRLLRMLFNYGAGSSEESIARFFEVYGPVVAIGRPGELLATPGSDRLYIPDEKWQETVKSEMIKSQAIVIQPGNSVGIQWEFEQVRALVEPYRILLSLVVFWKNPEAYERLREFAREHLAVEIPRVVPYLDRPAFIYFDRQWVPQLQELSYRCPALWPLTADAADLRYSLQPFIEGMFGGDREPPRPPRWNRGISKLISNFGAIILAAALIFGPLWVVHSATESFVGPLSLGPNNLVPEGLQIPKLVQRSAKETLNGKSVDYKIDVPESLLKMEPEGEMMEHWRRSPDSRFFLEVVAHVGKEDTSTFAQQCLQVTSGKDYLENKLASVRAVKQSGVEWTEVQVVVTFKNGIKANVISRITSDPSHGTVLLVGTIIEFSDSNQIYRATLDEIFQSVRFS